MENQKSEQLQPFTKCCVMLRPPKRPPNRRKGEENDGVDIESGARNTGVASNVKGFLESELLKGVKTNGKLNALQVLGFTLFMLVSFSFYLYQVSLWD